MTMPKNSMIASMLQKELNPFERFTDLLTGRDDRQDIMIMLLYEIALLLSGAPPEGGNGFPTGLQVNVPIAVKTYTLFEKRKALTTEVIYPTSLADCRASLRMVILIDNGFDQAVTADIIGNVSNVATSGTKTIATINVPAGESRGYGISEGEWYPYLGVQLTPAANPTTGEANAYLVHQVQGEV